ncbi:hypothetical protein GJAV_G00152730 [Gymnothorax javanicus]|nr:hypothetical protein GJAV_G00152730 [Gymnothorax javanicus]
MRLHRYAWWMKVCHAETHDPGWGVLCTVARQRSHKSSTCEVVEGALVLGRTLDANHFDMAEDLSKVEELGVGTNPDKPPEMGPFIASREGQEEGRAFLLSSSKVAESIGVTKLGIPDAGKGLVAPAVLRKSEAREVEVHSLPEDEEPQNHLTKVLSSPLWPKRGLLTDTESVLTTESQQSLLAMKRQASQLKTYPPSKKQRMQALQDGQSVTVHCSTQKKQQPPLSQGMSPPETSKLPMVNRPSSTAAASEGLRAQCLNLAPGISGSGHSHTLPSVLDSQAAAKISNSHLIECSEERDRGEMKRTETTFPRQRTKSVRSLSVEQPPLFVPDNAPTVKHEVHREGGTDQETVWDPAKHCAFCKKPHNNRFMVGCGRCDDWFHGECVGLDLAKAQRMEAEDQEYVCLKCCAEADRKSSAQRQPPSERPSKLEHSLGNNPLAKQDKQRQAKPPASGVTIVRRDSGERSQQLVRKTETRRLSNPDHRSGHTVRTQKSSGMQDRVVTKTTKGVKCLTPLAAAAKKPSVEEIRKNVRDSLEDILIKRLNGSDLKVSAERAAKVAMKTEKELFSFFRDTDSKYKSKYRSLMFNLKDPKNNVLFKRVLKGDISPENLIRLSPEQLASKELAAWRKRENRHTIEMIEKEQREVERRPITKITHKGEIEIENQEPAKEPEVVEAEPVPAPKPVEEIAEVPQEIEFDSTRDTTSLHKDHLFDLDCKICTGRMAPPVEAAATKVLKVATTVMRRRAGSDGDPPATSDKADGESFSGVTENSLGTKAISSEERTDNSNGGETEAAFLAGLQPLWKGFLNMPSVAKVFTKAYPVSGILDHVTEDLPNSIQVGGRIPPQTVWDYVEKIRTSGTKEICLIRFSPVTEEDEISYTLLYAYFSSRKRYGVIANNMKQVKDMYIIPLGSSEKIPHHLAPFDGPGLEAKRPNLLLGLIIRQRARRDLEILPVHSTETAFLPEKNTKPYSTKEGGGASSEDMDFFHSLKIVRPNQVDKIVESEAASQPVKNTASDSETTLPDPAKPLRFLPGVLSPPTFRSADGFQQSLQCTTKRDANKGVTDGHSIAVGSTSGNSLGSSGNRLQRFVVKKKDAKTFHETQAATSSPNNPDNKEKTSNLAVMETPSMTKPN